LLLLLLLLLLLAQGCAVKTTIVPANAVHPSRCQCASRRWRSRPGQRGCIGDRRRLCISWLRDHVSAGAGGLRQ
jgi:hypothetical protein